MIAPRTELDFLNDQARQRREVMMRRVLETLRGTVQVIPLQPGDQSDEPWYRVNMTDNSARVIAPLLDAVDILESMIFASDGCIGHAQCAHSMEPWQRARKLLEEKWHAATPPYSHWPDPHMTIVACLDCDWLGIAAELSAQACPKCDGRVCDQGSPEFTERLNARVPNAR